MNSWSYIYTLYIHTGASQKHFTLFTLISLLFILKIITLIAYDHASLPIIDAISEGHISGEHESVTGRSAGVPRRHGQQALTVGRSAGVPRRQQGQALTVGRSASVLRRHGQQALTVGRSAGVPCRQQGQAQTVGRFLFKRQSVQSAFFKLSQFTCT